MICICQSLGSEFRVWSSKTRRAKFFLRTLPTSSWGLEAPASEFSLSPAGSYPVHPLFLGTDCQKSSLERTMVKIYNHISYISYLIEGSLEVKLPTIWTDEKQSRAEAERRERLEERRVEEKE